MLLYNSRTQTKEEFIPLKKGEVSMYTCGPTVYHFAHIGNLRSYIMEDLLERYFTYEGNKVKRVMNITDVGHLASDADTGEDKMLAGAKREKKSVMEIAQYYTDAFFDDCDKLNIVKPEICVPATSLIDEYISFIDTLINKGFAYVAGGNVYFDTSKLDNYYAFGNFSAEDLTEAVRDSVESDDNKKSKTDFVLWFTKSKFDDQELKWDSPWGNGYPGWHIECSAICMKYLGDNLDIHCGGIDNAFPHHTNEIAQSEAYTGKKWCNHWFHVLHLNDTRGKMSKSKGGFLTVSLLEEKGYDPLAYRFFCLQSHYRSPLAFTFERLDNAVNAFEKLISRIALIKPEGEVDDTVCEEFKQAFIAGVGNDLSSSMGLTVLYDLLKTDTNGNTKLKIIESFDSVFGLDLINKAGELSGDNTADLDSDFVNEVENLIKERTTARAEKNWAKADEIRDKLNEMKIVVTDTAEGISWKVQN